MTNTEYQRKQALHLRKKKAAQRRFILILTAFVLVIFTLGAILGWTLGTHAFANNSAPTEIKAEENQTVTEPETKPLVIESEGNTLSPHLQEVMFTMCEKYNVPFALALAVADQETRFNPDAVSHTNDYGLMQINKINFEWLQKIGIDPMTYEGNIEAGVLMLSQAIEKHGEYGLALMAYNCGDAGAKRLWKKGIYSTEYSNSVMERYNKWDNYIRGV